MWTEEQQRQSDRKYRSTPEGRRRHNESNQRYNRSEHGHRKRLEARKKWLARPDVQERHRKHNREYSRRKARQLRELIFDHYGRRCSWPEGCDVTDPDMLQIDHVNGDGAEHRRKFSSGEDIYRSIVKAGFPPSFRILCANHNWKHRANLERQKNGKIG